MNVINIIPDSYQEYHPYHSVVFFLYGCNLNCNFCYNKEEVTDPTKIQDNILSYINLTHISPLHEAVVLLGGEPLIYPIHQLTEACETIKSFRNDLKIKIYTNGTYPDKIKTLCESGLVDSWSIDFKCLHNSSNILNSIYDDYQYVNTILKSLRIVNSFNLPFDVRTTKHELVDDDHVVQIQDLINSNNFSNVTYVIQEDHRPFKKGSKK